MEDIPSIIKDLSYLIHRRQDSTKNLLKIKLDIEAAIKKNNKIYLDRTFDIESVEYKKARDQSTVARKLQELIFPLSREHIKIDQKKVVPYARSGDLKFPRKHSFIATSLQETTTGLNREKIPQYILDGYSIEDAYLNLEEEDFGDDYISSGLTHRFSDEYTGNSEEKFEVLFITGEPYPGEKKDKMSGSQRELKSAIRKSFPDTCLRTTDVTKPTKEKIEKAFASIAKRLKENNTNKLYIFFSGHGDSEGYDKGIKEKDKNKQGAENFIFVLDKDHEMDEEEITKLYNKYLSDIEVISIFDACHSGAILVKSENKGSRLDLVA